MPKGVEHKLIERRRDENLQRVRIPMMPKGVEHNRSPYRYLRTKRRENSDDAERR